MSDFGLIIVGIMLRKMNLNVQDLDVNFFMQKAFSMKQMLSFFFECLEESFGSKFLRTRNRANLEVD